ncbi:hypothetical protein [Plantactinospora endophytica]|uniref:hypothetical protein n=1 Tax=Plantactinospora endophytica TaxID=673535 RepID=UPI001944970A|nr:hypothetical protein [Plantactinospora endophytica]
MTPVDPERGPSVFRAVRDHRRPPGELTARVRILLVLCLISCGLAGYQIAIRSLVHRVGVTPTLGLAVVVLGLVAVGLIGWRLAAGRSLDRWCTRNGWSPAAARAAWPWTPQQTPPGAVTVRFAAVKTLRGLSITVGELSWTRDGLGGSVEKPNGDGVFTVVRLPRSYPATAVQRRRTIGRRRAGEDEFLRKFRFIVDEPYFAHQLADPALRAAHLTGRIPRWAIVGDELYMVVASRLPLRPTQMVRATEQALYLLRLLGIRPPDAA